jgi:RNA polymerase sigma factor (sigma-70 family)
MDEISLKRIKMINETEAQNLVSELISLRERVKKNGKREDIRKLVSFENYCVEKFYYLIDMRTNRYKEFANYDDLRQEGVVALLKAIKNYNPKKGSFFHWAHRYITTRISRSANFHSVIRYPIKYARVVKPHKELTMPVRVEKTLCPDKQMEAAELSFAIENATKFLTEEQENILKLIYGLDGNKPMSINKACKTLGITRVSCLKMINNALSVVRENIKI